MKLKNVLVVVKDIEKSREFYHDLFGLDTILDHGGNMILTEGLVLQDEKIWRDFVGKEIVQKSNSCELYFEERDIEAFVEKLEERYPDIEYVNRLMTHSWGQKMVRFYDLDGHIIEVGEDMKMVIKRFLASGMTMEEVSVKMDASIEDLTKLLNS